MRRSHSNTLFSSRQRQLRLLLVFVVLIVALNSAPAVFTAASLQPDSAPSAAPFELGWSSTQADPSTSVAWGDYDGDGDLDLAVGNYGRPNQLFRNQNGKLELIWQTQLEPGQTLQDQTFSVAWGDYDGDGDLDLAVGNGCSASNQSSTPVGQPNRLYRNDHGVLTTQAVWSSAETECTFSLVWGDYDGDGKPDLAVGNGAVRYTNILGKQVVVPQGQSNRIYRNDTITGGSPAFTSVWRSPIADTTTSVAWGDYDGDGDLDLAVGNIGLTATIVGIPFELGDLDRIYRNMGAASNGAAQFVEAWQSTERDITFSVAWADVDGDGKLDLAVGNSTIAFPDVQIPLYRNRLYRNQGGALVLDQSWNPPADTTTSLSWGDYDGDGDPDLAVGNAIPSGASNGRQPDRIYKNEQGRLPDTPTWSSPETDQALGVAWGDMDGDGLVDLAVANGGVSQANIYGQPNRVYRNRGGFLESSALWSSPEIEGSDSVAWGDVDMDGDLDLAIGSWWSWVRLYRNDGGSLTQTAVWSADTRENTRSLAWGDVDGDGDPDLAVGNQGQPNRLYRNDGGRLTQTPVWSAPEAKDTLSVAWGDIDEDGDLDLAVGNWGQPNQLYRNDGGMLTQTPVWSAASAEHTQSVAWGDVDGDGDLDLAVGNDGQPNGLYRNDGGMLTQTPAWSASNSENTRSVAWGDVDGDSDLDLAVGNWGQPSRLYRNDGGRLTQAPAWSTFSSEATISVAWGDVDRDGDLDLAVGNDYEPSRLYANVGGTLEQEPIWSTPSTDNSNHVAWGDVDGDGDLDLAVANWGQPSRLYRNTSASRPESAPIPAITNLRSNIPAQANFYAAAQIWSAPTMVFTYTLVHPLGTPLRQVIGQYSLNGGGEWKPAIAATGTITTNLATSASGTEHTFTWDILRSGVLGQSDNVVFRLLALPTLTTPRQGIPGPYRHGAYAVTSLPFRLRGRQVRVMHGDQPADNALVYRLHSSEVTDGAPLADHTGQPFRTNAQGYLVGPANLQEGERLMALMPLTTTDSLTQYLTSARPLTDGLDLYAVTATGVQTLTVSAEHPLLLFDLQVALEWDARKDAPYPGQASYLAQLKADLKKASWYLYDFTDGQIALGHITVHQNADNWAAADIVVHASNRLRPFAVQGGIVLTTTVDPDHDNIIYDTGQIHIGAIWNRYGEPSDNLGEDWPLILAHELGHYLLFEEDTYLGTNGDGLLIPVDSCEGSAMGDLYDRPEQTEFIADGEYWLSHCAQTLAQQSLGRTEWQTIRDWYPLLHAPTALNPGPNRMPMNFTEFTIHDPITPTAVLDDPTFKLDYMYERSSSSEARAFLLRENRYAIDLGSPERGINQVRARGARPGDRLCAFDRPRHQYGCETITPGRNRLQLVENDTWTPVVQLSPVTSTTLNLQVDSVNLPSGLKLRAQLYPEYGEAVPLIDLSETAGIYWGTFDLEEPALAGIIHVWVDESASLPRREVLVSYTIGGNPGYIHAGGGYIHAGGGSRRIGAGIIRAGGGYVHAGGGIIRAAPFNSPDGHMIFFPTEPTPFQAGEFYAIQDMASLPELPSGKQVIGASYRLVAAPGTPIVPGSITFQYREIDAQTEGANEAALMIHFWDGTAWHVLDTVRNVTYNMASAHSQGPGVYALLSGVTTPRIDSVSPTRATVGVTTPLVIAGSAFLGPANVLLADATSTYTLAVGTLHTNTITVEVPPDLPAGEYDVHVINGDGGRAVAPKKFALYEQDNACFTDHFTSGSGQWTRGGDWNITTLPGGQHAMTDSPQGSYAQASGPSKRLVTSITSQPISLEHCGQAVLRFRHDYVLANTSTSQDLGLIDISRDGGSTWTRLATYSGDLSAGTRTKAHAPSLSTTEAEWADNSLREVQIDLHFYSGTVLLRFSLDVDDRLADKGWVIDDVIVADNGSEGSQLYLPLMSNH
jgi:FG-GAP-like repeat/FG-GAP repeat/IPT/TIG domain